MANEKHIPEDIILNILSRLPVKSLIRFSTVSKRWRFLILSDPQFARSHMEVACAQKTLGRRRLKATYPGLESLDLETPLVGDNSSSRKLTFPSNQAGGIVRLLGSCNGLVCVEVVVDDCEAWDVDSSTFYIWNPTTGLFQKLPDLVIGAGSERYHGFGYLSATNEYKLIIKNYNQVNIFSTRSHVWKNIESPFHWEPLDDSQGLLLNEALHWIPDYGYDNPVDYFEQSIHAFDLAKEEFLEKPLPTDILSHCGEDAHSFEGWLLGSFKGCLCVCRCDYPWPCECVVLWVLREYDVCYSWTKLFKLRISDQPAQFPQILIRGRITVVAKLTDQRPRRLMMIDHEEDQCCGPYMLGFSETCSYNVLEYEESLLWLEDYCNSGT